jgi:hypothetical protein
MTQMDICLVSFPSDLNAFKIVVDNRLFHAHTNFEHVQTEWRP